MLGEEERCLQGTVTSYFLKRLILLYIGFATVSCVVLLLFRSFATPQSPLSNAACPVHTPEKDLQLHKVQHSCLGDIMPDHVLICLEHLELVGKGISIGCRLNELHTTFAADSDGHINPRDTSTASTDDSIHSCSGVNQHLLHFEHPTHRSD
eukprot:3803102-Amphidinium_carterae.1